MDEIERAYDALMATFKHDAAGRVVIDLNDADAIARRRDIREFLAPYWPIVSKIREARAGGRFRR